MGKQTVILVEGDSEEDKITKWLGVAGIVAAVIGVLYFIGSCESEKQAKEEAAASIEETIIADETKAFGVIEELQTEAQSARARRLDSDRLDDARREAERVRRDAAIKAAIEEAAAIEEEARKETARQSALRDFSMSEAPSVWSSLQKERAERVSLDNRLSEILDALGGDSSQAENDETFLSVLRKRNESIRRIRRGTDALEEAFKLSVQAKANPSDVTLVEQKATALAKANEVFQSRSTNP